VPLLPLIVVALAAAFPGVAFAQSGQADVNVPVVVTTGEAVVRRAPDRAFVDVTVETRAKNPRDAQAQNAETMANLQRQLRAAGVAADAIRTITFTVEAEYDFANGRRTLRGFLARHALELRVDELGRLGELVDRATNSGATSIGDVRFDLKDRKAAEEQALGAAVQDARARAEAMASAAGRSIQAVWRISDDRSAPMPPPRPMLGMARAATESVPTPIVAGEIEIQAHVTLTALLK
jgi:uncharacterized protein YggE